MTHLWLREFCRMLEMFQTTTCNRGKEDASQTGDRHRCRLQLASRAVLQLSKQAHYEKCDVIWNALHNAMVTCVIILKVSQDPEIVK